MPPLTRWFLRSSLIFFVLALILGLVTTLLREGGDPQVGAVAQAFSPVYFHLFLVGWVTQLIFGVVFWMFPKYSMERPRGFESLGWASFILLNAGLILRAVFEPLQSLQPAAGLGWLLALSAVLQWLGGLAFVANTWGRVKEK